jgi:hypothetical protein
MYDGLGFGHRVALYGSHVLDGPRQLIKWLRPERPIDAADNRRSFMVHDTRGAGLSAPAPAIVLSDQTRREFMFGDPALSERQLLFATKIAELVAQHRVSMVILNLPTPEDFEFDRIWERADWPQILPGAPVVVGFRRTDLFGHGPASQFFSDSVHLNAEGQDRFTRSLTPFLMARYEELTNH